MPLEFNGYVTQSEIKWKHFPRYWPLVRGILRSPVNSPHKGLWRGALMFALIYSWVSNREAGDLRRHRAHYDVTVMQNWCRHHIAPYFIFNRLERKAFWGWFITVKSQRPENFSARQMACLTTAGASSCGWWVKRWAGSIMSSKIFRMLEGIYLQSPLFIMR